MGIETVIAFVLLFSALLSFILEKVSLDVTALCLLAIILTISSVGILENWPSPKEVLYIFTNEAPLTIAAMFVISSSLNKSRVLESVSQYLEKFCEFTKHTKSEFFEIAEKFRNRSIWKKIKGRDNKWYIPKFIINKDIWN